MQLRSSRLHSTLLLLLALAQPQLARGVEDAAGSLDLSTFDLSKVAEQVAGSGLQMKIRTRIAIKLRRVEALPLEEGGKPQHTAGYYVGSIIVGHPMPQELVVHFDTSGGNVVLPSHLCQDPVCQQKRRYSRLKSVTSRRINASGEPIELADKLVSVINIGYAQADLGKGEVTGEMVKDMLCVGPKNKTKMCTNIGMVAAYKMTDWPFRAMPHDGIVGLGLDALSINSPLFNFMHSLGNSSGTKQQFSIALRGAEGELTFGGVSPNYALPSSTPVGWARIYQPEDGYWQVKIEKIRVDNRTLNICQGGGCRGVVDSGAAQLGVPKVLAPKLAKILAVAPTADGGCRGPDLIFDLGGGTEIKLGPKDYADPDCGRTQLAPVAQELNSVFLLGMPVLQRYDTTFDWDEHIVGFQRKGE